MNTYYESRYIAKVNKDIISFFEESKKETLKEFVLISYKTVLLGNPGIGKTTELKELFTELWRDKDESSLFPFFINLKYFRKQDKFEDFIPYSDWKDLSQIIFILDGLDEVSDVHDFISSLEIFISQHSTLNYRYVVSCRTNLYEKYLIQLRDFEAVFLENLNEFQIQSLLKSKFAINVNMNELSKFYLKTPFFVDLFANYFQQNNYFPKSESEIWKTFVEQTISTHKDKVIKKKVIQTPILFKDLKKVAFVIELMQRNFFTEDELFEILGERYYDFLENPFITQDAPNYSFLHRQIQEYFVAITLKQLSFESLLDTIKVPETNHVYPNLVNSITFLMNLYEEKEENYDKLFTWIEQNQIEILFKSDSDRVSETQKTKVLQTYFKTQCIDKKFWINKSNTISLEEIAKFGNCGANFSYLKNIALDGDLHYRSRISALELLQYFSLPPLEVEAFKANMLDLLQKEEESGIIAALIQCIHSLGLGKNVDYLNEIIELFKDETNKEINTSLLQLLSEKDTVDNYFGLIEREFLLENKIKKREVEDKVLRMNSYLLDILVSKLNCSDNFIEIVSYYFRDKMMLSLDQSYQTALYKRLLFFTSNEDTFLIRLLSNITTKSGFYNNEKLLISLILETGKSLEIYKYIIAKGYFHNMWYFLSLIATEETGKLFAEFYREGNIIDSADNDIEKMRNVISNNVNFETAFAFQLSLKENGYVFSNELEKNLPENFRNAFQQEVQKNFNLLFNVEELLLNIKRIFNNNAAVLSSQDVSRLETEWYNNSGHVNTFIDVHLTLLHSLAYKKGSIVYEDLEKELLVNGYQYHIVKKIIEQFNNSHIDIKFQNFQIDQIKLWVESQVTGFDFDLVVEIENVNSYIEKPFLQKLDTIMFFEDLFKINLPQDFYLSLIQFYKINSFNVEDDYNILKQKIDDDKKFDNQIVDNLKNRDLFATVLSRHMEYALKNNLTDAFSKIAYFILDRKTNMNRYRLLSDFYSLTKDTKFLKDCCVEITDDLCWSAIKILIEKNLEKEFTISIAKKYLLLAENNYTSNAVDVLLHFNDTEVLQFLLDGLEKGIYLSISPQSYSSYSNQENISKVKEFYYAIYGEVDKDHFSSYDYRNFFESYIRNLSSFDDCFVIVQRVLKEIKVKIDAENLESFYINNIIDYSLNSYVISKSKPMSLKDSIAQFEAI